MQAVDGVRQQFTADHFVIATGSRWSATGIGRTNRLAIPADPGAMDLPVEQIMGPKLPTIGVGQKIDLALEMLHTAPALLVLSGGRPLSVMTRTDVLSFFDAQAQN